MTIATVRKMANHGARGIDEFEVRTPGGSLATPLGTGDTTVKSTITLLVGIGVFWAIASLLVIELYAMPPAGTLAPVGGTLSMEQGEKSANPVPAIPGETTALVSTEAQVMAAQTVSCLGDSLTASYPYEGSDNTYPARLQVLLAGHYGSGIFQVINRGISGHRADQVLNDLQSEGWMAQDNPDTVLLMVGGNDLAQEIQYPWQLWQVVEVVAQTTAEVQQIINTVKAHTNPGGMHPQIIVSAVPPNLLNGVFGSLAVDYYNDSLSSELTDVDLWITSNWDDLYDPVAGTAQASLMSDDVHPNVEGYSIMAQNWYEAISVLGPVTLAASNKTVDKAFAREGETVHHTIELQADGEDGAVAVVLTDTLPAQVTYRNDLWFSTGTGLCQSGVITWTGSVSRTYPVSITYSVDINDVGGATLSVENEVVIDTGEGEHLTRSATTVVNPMRRFLPVVLKE